MDNRQRTERVWAAHSLADALVDGPDYLYPPEWDSGASVPWYVPTIKITRQFGGPRTPLTVIRVCEVTNLGRQRRRLPVLRTMTFPRWEFARTAIDSGHFNMSLAAGADCFKMTRAQADELDERCGALTNAYKGSSLARYRLAHTPIMRPLGRRMPWKILHTRPRPTIEYHYSEDYIDMDVFIGDRPALDRAMIPLWEFAQSICVPRARLKGWHEGWHIPPDRIPRLWATDARREARKRS